MQDADLQELASRIQETIQGLVAMVGSERLSDAAKTLEIDLGASEPWTALDAARAHIASDEEFGPVENVVLSIAVLGAAYYQLFASSQVYAEECGDAEPPARAWYYQRGGRRFRTCNHSPSHTREA